MQLPQDSYPISAKLKLFRQIILQAFAFGLLWIDLAPGPRWDQRYRLRRGIYGGLPQLRMCSFILLWTTFFQSPFLFFFRSCPAHPHLSAYASETHQGSLITWLGSQDPGLFVFTSIAVTFVPLTRVLLPVAIVNVQRLFSRYIIYIQLRDIHLRDNRMTQFHTLTIPSHLFFPQWHIIIFWACCNEKKENLLSTLPGRWPSPFSALCLGSLLGPINGGREGMVDIGCKRLV